ncbi:MAG: hypothetical protein LBE34_03195 [Flavobacteriaceae bacterium]|jgi:hypothetical protein|nr:hypothetical protein [Flavobacteriaceae bacterium]
MNKQTSFGLITTVEVPGALNFKSSCWNENGLLIANYIVDDKQATSEYKIVYSLINQKGEVSNVDSNEGALPILFSNSKGEPFVYYTKGTSNDLKAIIETVNIKGEKERSQTNVDAFQGRFVGCTNESSIFYHVDIWQENEKDTITILRFDNQNKVTQKQLEIPLPKANKIFVENGEIHLITEMEEGWLHRQIDEEGKELKRRILDFDFPFVHEAISLSFQKKSYLLCEENGEIGVVEIEINGDCLYADLFNIGDEFFGTWHPQIIGEGKAAVQFTTEFGNGWLTIQEDELIELFYNKNKKGYKNLLTKETLEIDTNDLALGSINKVNENTFGLVFYPRKQRKETYNKVFILQHSF